MSGHSHYSSIKYKKAISDAQRGKVFSKISRMISVAAREKGPDPKTNSKLKLAIEMARSANMPKSNVERAIKRGTGQLPGIKLEEVIFEAYGPSGIALIIEGITDNKNRTLSEIKQILNQHQGKLASEGSVKWMFERKGCIIVDLKSQNEDFKDKERLEMTAIDSGVEDIYWHDDVLDVYAKVEDIEKTKKNLENQGIKIESASLDWVAKEMIEIEEKESCQKLFESLDENDAVQEIYSNLAP